jgi:urea transport system substrate-binding protein
LWKTAAEKAGTFDVDKVRDVLESGDISFEGPGGNTVMQKNHHTTKNVYIGETRANGQFKILKSYDQVPGEPFLLKGLDEKLAAMSK